MNPILADITWAQLGEIAGAVSLIGGFVIAIVALNRKTVTKVDQDPVPEFRKAAKRYNHDAIDARIGGVERQVAENTSEIESIWNTFRAEDQAIRKDSADSFKAIERALGRIEGRLGSNPSKQE